MGFGKVVKGGEWRDMGREGVFVVGSGGMNCGFGGFVNVPHR